MIGLRINFKMTAIFSCNGNQTLPDIFYERSVFGVYGIEDTK